MGLGHTFLPSGVGAVAPSPGCDQADHEDRGHPQPLASPLLGQQGPRTRVPCLHQWLPLGTLWLSGVWGYHPYLVGRGRAWGAKCPQCTGRPHCRGSLAPNAHSARVVAMLPILMASAPEAKEAPGPQRRNCLVTGSPSASPATQDRMGTCTHLHGCKSISQRAHQRRLDLGPGDPPAPWWPPQAQVPALVGSLQSPHRQSFWMGSRNLF